MSQEKEQPQGTLTKQRRTSFVMSPHHLFCNDKYSSEAKSLWVVLESKPEGWKFFWSEILKHFKEGRDQIKNALKELEKAGYVQKKRAKKGNIYCGMDIQVFYDPLLPFDPYNKENKGSPRVTEIQSPGDRLAEDRSSEDQSLYKEGFKGEKDLNNTNSTNKDLKSPLPPTEEKGGFKKFEGGVNKLVGMISDKALDLAKKNAPGWSIYYLMEIYIEGIEKRGFPDDINKAFPNWCIKYTKGKRPN